MQEYNYLYTIDESLSLSLSLSRYKVISFYNAIDRLLKSHVNSLSTKQMFIY